MKIENEYIGELSIIESIYQQHTYTRINDELTTVYTPQEN